MNPNGQAPLRPIEVIAMLGISAAMIAASAFHWWRLTMNEVLGFATGQACAWLVVREHLWNSSGPGQQCLLLCSLSSKPPLRGYVAAGRLLRARRLRAQARLSMLCGTIVAHIGHRVIVERTQ
jgi:hypothetical protein